MKFLINLFAKYLPTKDTCILELRRKIKDLTQENEELKVEVTILRKEGHLNIDLYDDNIEDKIIEHLQKAQKEICIAMAWLTSVKIIRTLSLLRDKGINIKIIVDKNRNNNYVRNYNPGNILKTVSLTNKSKYPSFMHNKYCIIDNCVVIDGSYNWTRNAKYNLEHIIVIKEASIAEMYRESFDKIFNNPKYFANYLIEENAINF